MSNIIRQARNLQTWFPMPNVNSNDATAGSANALLAIERQAAKAPQNAARYFSRLARSSGQQAGGGNGPTREPLWRPPTVWGQIP